MHAKFQVYIQPFRRGSQNSKLCLLPFSAGDQDPRLTDVSWVLRNVYPNKILICFFVFAQWSRVEPRYRRTDKQTNGRTDTANIGNNSLHLMHSVQPKNWLFCTTRQSGPKTPVFPQSKTFSKSLSARIILVGY